MVTSSSLAIITGASTGIGYELARQAGQHGYELLIAADEPAIHKAEVTVTCLMPGATETEFFERADMMDTKVGTDEKDDPADVAKLGFEAMMRGDGDIVSGWKNKLQSAVANVTPASILAEQHRKMAEPGTAEKSSK